jgi:hypothetical protein
MEAMETIEYRNQLIEIHIDEDPMDERSEYDHLGKMICFHKNYKLGDEHSYDVDETKSLYQDDENIALPLFVYEHGGITMNTTGFACPWDSGQVGIIFVTKTDVRKEYGWKRISKERLAKIYSYLELEIETYDDYISGNVYGYTTDTEYGVGDSCWGFFGYDHEKSGLLEMAKESIDCYLAEKKEAEDFADTIEFLEKRYQNAL